MGLFYVIENYSVMFQRCKKSFKQDYRPDNKASGHGM